jgi:hypothetical protein
MIIPVFFFLLGGVAPFDHNPECCLTGKDTFQGICFNGIRKKDGKLVEIKELPMGGSVHKQATVCIDTKITQGVVNSSINLAPESTVIILADWGLDTVNMRLNGKGAQVLINDAGYLEGVDITIAEGAVFEVGNSAHLENEKDRALKVQLAKSSTVKIADYCELMISGENFQLEAQSTFVIVNELDLPAMIALENVVIGRGSDVTVKFDTKEDYKTLSNKNFDIKVAEKQICEITLKVTTNPTLHSDKQEQNEDISCTTKSAMAFQGFMSPFPLMLAMSFVVTW